MIFGHEGLPRSGKSYEALLFHVLPALQAKRKVYVRLNGVGENLDKIAAHLAMPEEEVRALVHVMGDQEVHDWCVCDTDNDGGIVFPHIEKHALVVVDEAHEYWPTNRANLPERTGNFFAKHGHISLDIVVMTQDCKDLHRLIIRRMAKKNAYTKLDALGAESRYSVRFYAATGTGKYESVGTESRKYDPVIFPLYHGVQPGIESNAVYKGNTRTLWRTLRVPAIVMGIALLGGIWTLFNFFTSTSVSEEGRAVKEVIQAQRAKVPSIDRAPASQPSTVVAKVQPVAERAEKAKAAERLPPGVQYVLDIAATSRARHAGSYGETDIVEFRATGGGQVVDRFTTQQLWALGWSVKRTDYGVLVSTRTHEIIATSWPVDPFGEQSAQTTARIKAAGSPVTSASETQPSAAANLGGTIVTAGSNTAATFPESPQNRYSGG